MKRISKHMKALDPAGRRRVLRYIGDRYPNAEKLPAGYPSSFENSTTGEDLDQSPLASLTLVSLGALIAVARTRIQWERILVTAYWLQQNGHNQFGATMVHQALSHAGYGVSNITREMQLLRDRGFIEREPERKGHQRFHITAGGRQWCRERLAQQAKR